ncbi:N-acetylmuramoyl-L-alanine amidase [Thioalkalivibrio sp. ARh3]|uniref:N-acetylmuramoyl-L-alanine amidase n=1 Tax=Thioalkalivibrio sp. ARh3 TaxID=1158148 RepID=UPI0003A8E166|nr:N-acetylmuramoyl-L-alanine amidase [Thioalkalivibrio sp. ARh3]
MSDMREINQIIIHCADTPPSLDIGADTIQKWHVDGNGWRDIGYHYVIRRDGTVDSGRPLEQAGAHVRGQNDDSIGICLVGGQREQTSQPDSNFTAAQWRALESLVKQLQRDFPGAKVSGHRDHDNSKACPCFDAKAWARGLSDA